MVTDRKFALRLLLAQEARGLTQTELAKAIGTTPSVVCLLLQGKTHPSYETLISLARQLCVSTDYLCGMKELTDDTGNTSRPRADGAGVLWQ